MNRTIELISDFNCVGFCCSLCWARFTDFRCLSAKYSMNVLVLLLLVVRPSLPPLPSNVDRHFCRVVTTWQTLARAYGTFLLLTYPLTLSASQVVVVGTICLYNFHTKTRLLNKLIYMHINLLSPDKCQALCNSTLRGSTHFCRSQKLVLCSLHTIFHIFRFMYLCALFAGASSRLLRAHSL